MQCTALDNSPYTHFDAAMGKSSIFTCIGGSRRGHYRMLFAHFFVQYAQIQMNSVPRNQTGYGALSRQYHFRLDQKRAGRTPYGQSSLLETRLLVILLRDPCLYFPVMER
jgi:hypothetical protein